MVDENIKPEDEINDGFNDGFQMGLYAYGKICLAQTSCEDCALSEVIGDVTCKEFMIEHPDKMQGAIEQLLDEPKTYLSEFVLRFPNNYMPLEVLAQTCCRKAIFEGTVQCDCADDTDLSECMKCWLEPYEGDIQLNENGEIMENGRPKATKYCKNCGEELNEDARFCKNCGSKQ